MGEERQRDSPQVAITNDILRTFCVIKKQAKFNPLPFVPVKFLNFIDGPTFKALYSAHLNLETVYTEDQQYIIHMNYVADTLRREAFIIKPVFDDESYLVDVKDACDIKGVKLISVDCGPYKSVRSIEHILRFLIAIRLRDADLTSRTVVTSSNYGVCVFVHSAIFGYFMAILTGTPTRGINLSMHR